MEKVLETLCKRNLTLNDKNCKFGMRELVFMGHRLSENGIAPTDEKIKAVQNAKTAENAAEVRSFLGLVGFCGRYIDSLAHIEQPLRKLTRSNEPWNWGSDQEKAFSTLKQALVSAGTMAYFDLNAKTRVFVDASPVGLGAILTQQQKDGNHKPVIYASRSLSDVER